MKIFSITGMHYSAELIDGVPTAVCTLLMSNSVGLEGALAPVLPHSEAH